mgnify:CR=1 FL=1
MLRDALIDLIKSNAFIGFSVTHSWAEEWIEIVFTKRVTVF